MKVKDALSKFTGTFTATVSKVTFKVEQKAPEICLAIGIAGVLTATVIACKATLSLPDIIDETKEQEEELKAEAKNTVTVEEDGDIQEEADSDRELKNKIRKLYVTAGFNIAKLYIPAAIIGSIALALILKSHFTLVSRNIALAAGYAALVKEFEEYRKNVIRRYGENVDKELRFNINSDEIKDAIDNDEEKSTAILPVRTRFLFDETTSDLWQRSVVYNVDLLSLCEHNLNELLRAKGHLFVNNALEELHMAPIQSGQDNGWYYDPKVEHKIVLTTYVLEDNSGIWIDFNIDGDIRHCLCAA